METIKRLLALLPVHMNVSFALYCALDVKCNLDVKDTASLRTLELVEKWLRDPSKVSSADLHAASSAFSAAAYAASAYAASAAASSASSASAYAASAAAASYAASAAASYAASAAASSYAASYAASSRDDKLKQYEAHLRQMIKDISKLEKEIYDLKDIA